ncbi:hypothetical protein BDW69DRAFT_187345 [Aspergillus filifer]
MHRQLDIWLAPLRFKDSLWILILGTPESSSATYIYIFDGVEQSGIKDHRCPKYVDDGANRSLTLDLLAQTTPVKIASVDASQKSKVLEMVERSRVSLMNEKVVWPGTFAEYLYCFGVVRRDIGREVVKKVGRCEGPGGRAPIELVSAEFRATQEDYAQREKVFL